MMRVSFVAIFLLVLTNGYLTPTSVRPRIFSSRKYVSTPELSEVAAQTSILAAIAAIAGWARVESKIGSIENVVEAKLDANTKEVASIADRISIENMSTKEKISELQMQLKDDKSALQEQLSKLEIEFSKTVAITVQKALPTATSETPKFNNLIIPPQRRAEAGGFFNAMAPLPPQALWDGRRLVDPQQVKPYLPSSFLPETDSSPLSK
mmetsp:Transcript_15242/g.20158  ORF Transcript_15242/g.20158 Transcript_15242/m.20158 type:complete len:209 (-) Transcript_15242:1433-2059(-)